MEITESMVYWITRLDGIVIVEGILTGVFAGLTLLCILWCIDEIFIARFISCGKIRTKAILCLILTLILTIACFFGTVLTPTTKQMCVIKVLPVIANNEEVQQLPNKVVDLANNWLDELKPNKENN